MIWLEDFTPGQKFVSDRLRVDATAIKAFGRYVPVRGRCGLRTWPALSGRHLPV